MNITPNKNRNPGYTHLYHKIGLQYLIRLAILQMGIQRNHDNVLHSSWDTRKIDREEFFKSIWNAIK